MLSEPCQACGVAEPSIMDLQSEWGGRRYYPISQYFRQRFGERIAKISVSVADNCPNRSSPQQEACIFCDQWGSAAYHLEKDRDLLDQIRHNKTLVTRRLKARNFLVYFQSYTNTLDKVPILKQRFDLALGEDYVQGLVVGTRPDCLPERLYPLFQEISERSYLMVELGIQSFFDEQLAFLRRGHTVAQNIQAIEKLHRKTDVDIGVHLIFGMPDETKEHILKTAEQINQLPVSNVKLHNLHVLANTGLAELYEKKRVEMDDLETYAEKVILFLRHLSPTIAVQRLAAVANRWDELIAPKWTAQKMQPVDFIENTMRERGVWQGDCYKSPRGRFS